MGEIHPQVAENYGLGTRVYVSEMFFDNLIEFADREVHYVKPPKFPSMSRDLAMVVDEDTPAAEIERIIRGAGDELLREVKLFDVYRGEQVGEGKKSVAYNIVFRHDDRTLTDDETERAQSRIIDALREKIGAVIRDN